MAKESVKIDFPGDYARLVALCAKNHGIESARRFVEHDVNLITDALISLAKESDDPQS